MKNIFYLILIWSSTAFCQIDINPPIYEEPQEVKELFQYLNKAFAGKTTILVPFMENEKFGYLDYETLEIVVPPVASHLALLNTASKKGFIGVVDEYFFVFDEKGNLIFTKLGPPQVREELPPSDWVLPTDSGVEITPKTDEFKGFTYTKNKEGKIYVSSFSEIYDSGNPNNPNLILIEIEGEVYGIAGIPNPKNYNNLAGIISPDGKPLKGFDFNFNKILPLKGLKEILGNWFLVRKSDTDDSRFHFVNSKGEFLSETILPKLDYSQNFTKTQISTPYYIPKSSLHYAINDNKIIDLYELKLIDAIPENYEILYLNYIVVTDLESENIELLRKNAKMFAAVKDEKGNWFYMDFNGKKYIPKK